MILNEKAEILVSNQTIIELFNLKTDEAPQAFGLN